MNEWTNNTPSRGPGLTLAEAAITSGWSVNELLNFGALGKIKIHVQVPEDYVVFDIDDKVRTLAKKSLDAKGRSDLISDLVGYEPKERNVNGLFLSRSDCEKISKQGHRPHSQDTFREAWVETNDTIEIITPSVIIHKTVTGLGGKPTLFGRTFAFFRKNQTLDMPKYFHQAELLSIEISIEKLFIFEKNLHIFLSKNPPSFGKLESTASAHEAIGKIKTEASKKPEVRRQVWDQIIEDAMAQVKNKYNMDSVFDVLRNWAKSEKPPYPLLRYDKKDDVIFYEKHGRDAKITRRSLTEKLGRIKNKEEPSATVLT